MTTALETQTGRRGGSPTARMSTALSRGVFTLSLDFELIWGTLDLFGPGTFRSACEREREVVIDRLLALLEEFEVPATWCILGHLFLERCDGKHDDIARPQAQWFAHDPGTDLARDPIFYGRDLVQKIRDCRVPQEIGSHSFSHVLFREDLCSRETAATEIAACKRIAREQGIELRSFVFPRNLVGHLDVLREHGFTSYRGPEPSWYEASSWPAPLKRLAHLWDVLSASEPPVVLPEVDKGGLCNIPGSMIYFPMHGLRRYVPMTLRVKRAFKGLDAAVRDKRVFHLWFHPTNLSDGTDEMFEGLRAIFKHARELRESETLEFRSMRDLVPAANGQ